MPLMLLFEFFCLIAIAIVSIGAAVSLFLLLKKIPLLLRIAMAACVLILPIVWFVRLIGPYEPTSQKDLASAYRVEFGSEPPPDVTDIQSRQVVVGDSAAGWLRFRASPETIDKLLSRFTACDKATFEKEASGRNSITWWKPKEDGMAAFYSSEGWRSDFLRSHAYLAHDAQKHLVYFVHHASD